MSGLPGLTPTQSLVCRLVVHLVLSMLIFVFLVVVGHLNVVVAAVAIVTGSILSIALRLAR